MKACSACGEQNPDKAKFCLECGEPLGASSARHEERKVVTVLFADLVGFTSRSERMDVEDVRGTLQPYHQLLRRELERHGGTVEKFIGDAVMALFGAPVAHEDDAERAVRAALAIQDAVARLRERESRLDLHVRIGVNTGEALVALASNPAAGEGMASGDVVNTAARLQTAAPVDGVLVGEATYRATDRAIRYDDAAPVTAKGKTEPVRAWVACEPRSLLPEQARVEGLPLVGRDTEVGLVLGAFDRSRQEPSTQLVTLVGAPGIGKTRLVEELSVHVEELPGLIRWRRGRSLSYGEGIAFWALGEMVKAEAGILESDTAETAIGKLGFAVDAVITDTRDRQWVARHLRPLVGLDAEQPVSAEGGRAEAFAAWRRFFEALADDAATVLVFEDAHWADEALLDFIDLLAERAGRLPLLIVCTARPELLERRPAWGGGKINAHTINLTPLSEADTARLVADLLEQALLPAETQQALLARAEGNPLYAQEYVRMLRDQGLLVREPGGWRLVGEPRGLPESVQGIISARLDTLKPEEKRLLQDAAVIGKTAWLGSVCLISDMPTWQAEEHLHQLERQQLVMRSRHSSVSGELEFSFAHALTRDVAYGQIPRSERASKHERAADWIAALAGQRDDKAELVAYHMHTALRLREQTGEGTSSLIPRVLTALAEAGRQALAVNAYAAAARHFREAIELTPADGADRPRLLLQLAAARYHAGQADEAILQAALDAQTAAQDWDGAAEASLLLSDWLDNYIGDGERAAVTDAQGLDYATRRGYTPLASLLEHGQAYRLVVTGHIEEAIAYTEAAIRRADDANDAEGRALLLSWHGYALAGTGDPKGVQEIQQAAALLAEHGPHVKASSIYHNLAETLVGCGDLPGAAEARRKSTLSAERFGDSEQIGSSKAAEADAAYHAGNWDEAMALSSPYYDDASVFTAITARTTGIRILLARGEHRVALNYAEATVAAALDDQSELGLAGLALLAVARHMTGNLGTAQETCRAFFARWHDLGGAVNTSAPLLAEIAPMPGQSDAVRFAAELLPDLSRWKPALIAIGDQRFADAVSTYAEIGSLPLAASAQLRAGQQAASAGDDTAAIRYAEQASSFYNSVGASTYLHEAGALLTRTRSA